MENWELTKKFIKSGHLLQVLKKKISIYKKYLHHNVPPNEYILNNTACNYLTFKLSLIILLTVK